MHEWIAVRYSKAHGINGMDFWAVPVSLSRRSRGRVVFVCPSFCMFVVCTTHCTKAVSIHHLIGTVSITLQQAMTSTAVAYCYS